MLDSILGARLILLLGKTLPLPASPAVMNAIDRIEVTNDADQGDGFQMTFTLSKGPLMDYTLLQSGAVDLFNRVVIAVAFGAVPEVIIDGVITHHQLAPSNEPGQSTLTVTGKDLSLLLDLEEKNEAYPNQPDWIIVSQLLGAYAQYGIVPTPTPTTDVPIELERIPRQHETDLTFIERMARRNGYVFYIEPLLPGTSTAYWGPENRLSLPQPALTANMGAATNVEQISFTADALAPVETEGATIEPITKTTIPLPSLPPLRVPPLSAAPLPARRKVQLRDTGNRNVAQAALASVAETTGTPDPVTGTGSLDSKRYGHALRARKLVGVRGVGLTYDGFYFVRRVTHEIKHGQYKQSFTISRDGTGTLTPFVVP